MSSKTPPSENQGGSPMDQSSRSTPTPNGKETTSSPNANADVELKNMQSNAPKGSIPLGEDIMQLARIGEIGAMQNLFANKNLTANHRDAEGITPLHVRLLFSPLLSPPCSSVILAMKIPDSLRQGPYLANSDMM